MAKAKKKKTTYQQKTRRISRWRGFKRNVAAFFRMGYYATGISCLAVAIGAGWWWVHSGQLALVVESSKQAVLAQTARAGLSLQYIYLDGRSNFKAQEGEAQDRYMEGLKASLGLQPGDPILGLSVDDIQSRIKELSWVKDVSVERQLPSTLHIHVEERHPVAVWQHSGKLQLIDEGGNVIEGENAKAPKYGHLLLVVGTDAPQHTMELLRMLNSAPELLPQVSSAIRVGNRRWDVRFRNELEVKLPADNPQRAWTLLAKMEREQGLMERDVRKVDLRLEDRLFLDVPPESRPQGGNKPLKSASARET